MENINCILNKTIKKYGKKRLDEEMIIQKWSKIVGSNLIEQAYPFKVKNKVLFIKVKNSSWSHHLSFMKYDLINKINTYFKAKVIKDILFQVGKIDISKEKVNHNVVEPIEKSKISDNNKQKIAELLEDFPNSDKELKDKLENLLKKEFIRREERKINKWKPCFMCNVLTNSSDNICPVCQLDIKK